MKDETKTIREWLSELPEPIRSRAIRNADNCHKALLDKSKISLREAVSAAFMWINTPEGFGYWSAVYDGYTPELPEHLNENQ